MYDTCK